jgi:hypothetical protein
MKQSTGRLFGARQLSRQSALGIGMAAAVVAGFSACHGSTTDNCHYVPQAIGVFGQPSFIANVPNNGGVTLSSLGGVEGSVATLDLPTAPYQDSPFYIADTTNNRILVYSGLPTIPQATGSQTTAPQANPNGPGNFGIAPAANAVLGSGTAGTGPNSFDLPSKVSLDYNTGTTLVVTDTGNNRVLIYNTLPVPSGSSTSITATPSAVVGQPNFNANGPNTGTNSAIPMTCTGVGPNNAAAVSNTNGNPSQCNLNDPTAAFIAGGSLVNGTLSGATLVVVDKGNHRVLLFPYPLTNGNSASVVLGQSPTCNEAQALTTPSAFVCNTPGIDTYNGIQYTLAMNEPTDVWTNGSIMLITDTGNHRVLAWTNIPQTNDALPTGILGQAQFGETSLTGATGTQGMHSPYGVGSDGTNVFVADTGNNRVLEFQNYITSVGLDPAASEVFGQADFTHVINNDPDQNSQVGDQRNDPATNGVTAGSLYSPQGVYANANLNALYVTDTDNSRILQYTITSNTQTGDTGVNGSDPQNPDYCF